MHKLKLSYKIKKNWTSKAVTAAVLKRKSLGFSAVICLTDADRMANNVDPYQFGSKLLVLDFIVKILSIGTSVPILRILTINLVVILCCFKDR